MYICLCKGLTENDVQQAGRAGITSGSEIIATFGLKDTGCCGRCAKNIHELVALASGQLART